MFGEQFDDDRNTLVLGSGAVVDVSVLRAAGRRTTFFFNLENLLDDQYEVGRSPVATYGQPFTLHARRAACAAIAGLHLAQPTELTEPVSADVTAP